MLIARHKLRLLISVFLIIVAVSVWINTDERQSNSSQISLKTVSDIDFFIEEAQFKSFDHNGQIHRTATSVKLEHYQQAKQSIAQNMTIDSYRDHQIQASITGLTAIISEQRDDVVFREDVIVTSYKSNIPKSKLETQILTYDRQKQLITTDQFVEFTDTLGNTITATGLSAHINLSTIHLKHNVKGIMNAN